MRLISGWNWSLVTFVVFTVDGTQLVFSMLLPQVEACVKVIDALRVCIGPSFLVPNTPAAGFENICDLYKAYVTRHE